MAEKIERELTLKDLIAMCRRRRKVSLSVFCGVLLLVALYCAVCTRRYQAVGVVQVQKEGSDAMGLESMMGGMGGDSLGGMDSNLMIQTQVRLLQSDSLALQVMEKLNMESSADFRARRNPIKMLLRALMPSGPADAPGVKLSDAPQRRERALKIFAGNLKVKQVSGTRMIEVDYLSSDPKLAADVVNNLMQSLTDYNFQTRFNATNQASTWLATQLGDLRKQTEDLQAKVAAAEQDSGVYNLDFKSAEGHDLAYSGVLDQMQISTQARMDARRNLILKEAVARAAANGDAELLSGLAGNSASASSVNGSMNVLQSLRAQEAAQEAALRQAEAKYGSEYPKLEEMRANVEALKHSIREEANRIAERAQSDLFIARQQDKQTQQDYDQHKREADVLNNKAIAFTILRQEAEDSRQLYEDLLKRLKEAGILQGLKSSNITVVDPGRVPAQPKTPDVPLYMSFALLGGACLGLLSGLLADALDNKVHDINDLETLSEQSALGMIPFIDSNGNKDKFRQIMVWDEPNSTFSECLRAIRTSVLLARGDTPPKIALVTSSVPGEGKSLFCSNFAAIMAQNGKKVLLVDADMRMRGLSRSLNFAPTPGLSALLSGQVKEPTFTQFPKAPNLDLLFAGAVPPNPSELLGSEAMHSWLERWRNSYDFILIDCPPVLPVTDAVVLNPMADLTIVMARSRVTSRNQLDRTYQTLTRDGGHYVGLVLNGVNAHEEGYYTYYGYNGYRSNAYTSEDGDA